VRRLALIGLLALVSSACTIDVDLGIELTPSGSGSLSVNILTDDEFESLFALTGREFEDLIASRGADVGLSFVVVPDEQNRYFADGATVSPETLTGILEGLFPGIGTMDISSSETALEFDARLNALTDIDDIAVYFEGTDPAEFADDVSVTVRLSPPGPVDSSTATQAGSGDLVWEIPFASTPTRVFARTVVEEEGGSFPWTLAVGLGTLAVAIGFLMAIRSRLQEDESPTGPPSTGMTPDSTPPEQQLVGVDNRPPEEQSVAPEAEAS
jgi:hypothetical protein